MISGPTRCWAAFAGPIPVEPNTNYLISGWIYKQSTSGNAYIDLNDIPGELQMGVGYAEAWQYVSGVWNSGANTSVILRLVTDGYPNGATWFDDVSLTRPSGQVAAASTDLGPAITVTEGYQPATNRSDTVTNIPAAYLGLQTVQYTAGGPDNQFTFSTNSDGYVYMLDDPRYTTPAGWEPTGETVSWAGIAPYIIRRYYPAGKYTLTSNLGGGDHVVILGVTGLLNATRSYYYAGASRLAMRADGVLYYLLGDHLGSTSIVTDSYGGKVAELRYKAWGEIRWAWGTANTKYQYTGQYSYTAEFGLYFYGSRFYDPYITQFSQPDSIIPDQYNSLDWNRYAYARYNPQKYVDPSGHKPCESIACNGETVDATALADSIKNDPASQRYWAGLTEEEQSVLKNAGWWEGAFNDHMSSQTSPADFWHDPLTYLLITVGGGRMANTLAGLLPTGSAGSTIGIGTTVYRVWGSDPKNPGLPGSGPWGHSWSPVNPSTIENFRNLAGLPSGGGSVAFNTARFVSIGEIIDPTGIAVRQALSLDGQAGGLLEYIIPDPRMQILLKFVGGVNPPY